MFVKITKIIQFQMLQNLQEQHMLEMKTIKSFVTNHSSFLLYIMESIIKETYQYNFGSAYETYRIAIKRNPSIRLQYVKHYLNKLEYVQVNFKYKQYNSFVSPKAGFEYEVDIMDVLARDGGHGIRYGLCAIYNFTKVVSIIPIKTGHHHK